MVVVSNTSPLRYFVAVQQTQLLPQLFTTVHVPQAVVQELSHSGTPLAIRQWISNHPAWLVINSLKRSLDADLAADLDKGEAEAIQLAVEQHADLLILDEWKGRVIAQRRCVPLTGALGILGLAYQRRILEEPLAVLAAMREQGFRISDGLASRFQHPLQTRFAR